MTCHYAQRGSDSDWLKQISHAARPIRGKHYPDLACDTLSVWSLCARFSDVISRPGKPRREMTAVFGTGYRRTIDIYLLTGFSSLLKEQQISYSQNGNGQ